MKTRENMLLLLCGPTVTIVGIDILSKDATRGLIIILMSVFLTSIGSNNQWVNPKNRSNLWLFFPVAFSAFGYIPLILLRERKRIITSIGERFISVAANITKYYLELKNNYYNRFNNEATLLAGTGLIEVERYLGQKISLEQILSIAKQSVLANEGALVDFIINLEIKLFQIEAPEFGISEVTEACFEKKRDIECVVQKIKREYLHETEIAYTTSKFIISYPFQKYRIALGIND
ncbi:hypothetical protein ACFLX3_03025 [Chloroflexota bacterium]